MKRLNVLLLLALNGSWYSGNGHGSTIHEHHLTNPRTTTRKAAFVLAKIILVTGGACSGKSLFAEQYAASSAQTVAYIATAQTYDDEMKERVKLHKQRRPAHWLTWESPYDAHEAVAAAAEQAETLLFDCLTLYITNLMLAPEAPADKEERFCYIRDKITCLLDVAMASDKTVIFVTNEVGQGIVPDNALAREYRDLAGSINQQVAAAAQEVYLTVSGIAVNIKQLAAQPGRGENHR